MTWLVGDLMQVNVRTVAPDVTLPRFEAILSSTGLSGMPVVLGHEFLGVASRADVITALCRQRELAESTSDYYFDELGFHEVPLTSYRQIADRWGESLETLCVADIMTRQPIVVVPTRPLPEAAALMMQHRIHRLPVVDEGRLVGMISSLDFVGLFANHRVDLRGE